MSSERVEERHRATSLGPHDVFLLDQWGRQLYEAFGEMPYLVGSVARADSGWRDVDVRMLDPLKLGNRSLARRSLNVAVSLWGKHVTSLPIDFQFQVASEFHEYDGDERNPCRRARRASTDGARMSGAGDDRGATT